MNNYNRAKKLQYLDLVKKIEDLDGGLVAGYELGGYHFEGSAEGRVKMFNLQMEASRLEKSIKTCNCEEVCLFIDPPDYVNPTYHHGKAEGLHRSEVCPCGWWTCGGRGCGDCPDCYGEKCECWFIELD
jgi:hypothetical protein